MKKRLITAISMAAVMAFSLTACGSAASSKAGASSEAAAESTQASESASEASAADTNSATFTVGFDQDFPPMGFKGEDGSFTGFDLDLAAEAAKRLGLEVVYQPIAWDSKDAELDAGTIDCIWNGFTMTGREDGYEWSSPYLDNSQVFVVRDDSDINSAADLAGKTVEVQADSSAEAALKEDANKALADSFGTLQTTPDYNTALMDLDMGAVDAIAMDSTVAEYKITKGGLNFRTLDEPFASEEYGVGFKKGNTELRDKVDGVLKEMAADGTMAEISTKWFGKDITTIK
ncbi:MAG: amino acid ABC transporter substrate-binding protein [Lachnospiraceae bacterium]|nr:amino acid ABC transporter substrate-binding protein [Lachnospiraceae bacterium]